MIDGFRFATDRGPNAAEIGMLLYLSANLSCDMETLSPPAPSEDEASFLAVTKAGIRGMPQLPEATDWEWISFGYEICDRLDSVTSQGVDPKEAAESAVVETLFPDGLMHGGKSDVLNVRIILQWSASEFLCTDPRYREWADAFREGVFEALAMIVDDGADG